MLGAKADQNLWVNSHGVHPIPHLCWWLWPCSLYPAPWGCTWGLPPDLNTSTWMALSGNTKVFVEISVCPQPKAFTLCNKKQCKRWDKWKKLTMLGLTFLDKYQKVRCRASACSLKHPHLLWEWIFKWGENRACEFTSLQELKHSGVGLSVTPWMVLTETLGERWTGYSNSWNYYFEG
jgi:hypothetical protein